MITIKSEHEIELMRKAGMLVSKTHEYLKPFIKPGITTLELDRLAEEFIRANDGIPTCKGYEGFPNSLCISSTWNTQQEKIKKWRYRYY